MGPRLVELRARRRAARRGRRPPRRRERLGGLLLLQPLLRVVVPLPFALLQRQLRELAEREADAALAARDLRGRRRGRFLACEGTDTLPSRPLDATVRDLSGCDDARSLRTRERPLPSTLRRTFERPPSTLRKCFCRGLWMRGCWMRGFWMRARERADEAAPLPSPLRRTFERPPSTVRPTAVDAPARRATWRSSGSRVSLTAMPCVQQHEHFLWLTVDWTCGSRRSWHVARAVCVRT